MLLLRLTLRVLVGVAAFTGCTTAQLQIDPDLKAHGRESLVTEKPSLFDDKPFIIGTYKTEALEVSSAQGTGGGFSVGGIGKSTVHKTQTFRFTLSSAKSSLRLKATCAQMRNKDNLKFGNFRNTEEAQNFTCQIVSDGNTVQWLLTLDGKEGTLSAGEAQFTIRAENEAQDGMRFTSPLGFSFHHKTTTVATVFFTGESGFWLRNNLPDGDGMALATAAAALLVRDHADSTK